MKVSTQLHLLTSLSRETYVDSMIYKLYWIEKAYLENNEIMQSAHDRDRSCNITWTRHSFTAVVSQIPTLDASDSTLSMTTNHASAECALGAGHAGKTTTET